MSTNPSPNLGTSAPPVTTPAAWPSLAASPTAAKTVTGTPGALTVPIAALEQRHEWHALFNSVWDDLDILHQGSKVLQMVADRFLIRRPKEGNDVYQIRIQRFSYHNLLATGVGYYIAKLRSEERR